MAFFELAPQDQSIAYLSQLFGYVGGVLPTTATTIMGPMFKTINTAALVVGAILVSHTTVVGLLKTAQEGEFLGRQWNSLWVPLRMVMGIGALFPTGAGYSVLQVIMMWVIVQGIGAADELWGTVLKFTALTGSPYASFTPPSSGINLEFQNLFKAMVCQASARRTDNLQRPDGSGGYFYYCGDPATSNAFCSSSLQDLSNVYGTNSSINGANVLFRIGPRQGQDGACGTLIVPNIATYSAPSNATNAQGRPVSICQANDDASRVACAGLQAQKTAIAEIVTIYGQIAERVADNDFAYMNFYANQLPTPPAPPQWIGAYCQTDLQVDASDCCVVPDPLPEGQTSTCFKRPNANFPPSSNVLSGGAYDYRNMNTQAIQRIIWPYGLMPTLGASADIIDYSTKYYSGTINAAVVNAAVAQPVPLQGWQEEARKYGWLLAGAYYYRLASMNNTSKESAMPPLSVRLPEDPLPGYRTNLTAAGEILSAINNTAKIQVSSAPPAIGGVSSALDASARDLMNGFQRNLTQKGTNPIVGIQSFGRALLITGQVVYPVFMAIGAVTVGLSNINVIALGTGLTSNGIGQAIQFLFYSLLPLVLMFIGLCFTIGSLLGIYTPLIPYMIFTFGAIGWFTSVLEALVAAPFVALGILSPGGQHEILGRAEPALMITFNIFLRPMLMIFGMMAGMLLAPVVVNMFNSGFNAVLGSFGDYSKVAPGPAELFLFIASYTFMILAIMNKCFSLIYLIPERVLTWIGGQAINYGEGEALGGIKSQMEGAAAGAGSFAKDQMMSPKQMKGKKDGEAAVK